LSEVWWDEDDSGMCDSVIPLLPFLDGTEAVSHPKEEQGVTDSI
jgi:hypothetical protein